MINDRWFSDHRGGMRTFYNAGGQKTSSSGSSTGQSRAFFGDTGQGMIGQMAGQAGAGAENQNALGGFLNNFMQNGGNPLQQGAMDARRDAAQSGFDQNLAQVRSQGNRGGIARDVMNQAGVGNQFQSNLHANELGTMANQFNADRTAQLQGADLLRGLGGQQAGQSNNLLSLLRGEDTSGTEQSTQTTAGGGVTDALGGIGSVIGGLAPLLGMI